MDNIVSLTYFQQKNTVISVQSELLKKNGKCLNQQLLKQTSDKSCLNISKKWNVNKRTFSSFVKNNVNIFDIVRRVVGD